VTAAGCWCSLERSSVGIEPWSAGSGRPSVPPRPGDGTRQGIHPQGEFRGSDSSCDGRRGRVPHASMLSSSRPAPPRGWEVCGLFVGHELIAKSQQFGGGASEPSESPSAVRSPANLWVFKVHVAPLDPDTLMAINACVTNVLLRLCL
jgi:hypothetical protein